MDPARWHAARALFDEVVDVAPAARAERLADVARRDPELHRAVERLLDADGAADTRLAPLDAAFGPASGSAPDARPTDPLGVVGRAVAHFRVIAPIAAGGMGVVYRAEDTRLQRTVALKLPLPHCLADAAARRRFLREGRAAGALDHPNVCVVHEVGESADGHLFIAMALCPGETLKACLARDGALSIAQAVDVARAIARGLGAAHAAGIVHRDVKPGNVMLLPDGGVKVLDFGLALVRDLGRSASRTTAGTVAYMAPEQLRNEPVDARVDLWALGVVLYEMLARRPPFVGDHEAAVTYAIVHEEPTPLTTLRADVPDAVDGLVRSLLMKDPARRPRSAEGIDVALGAALEAPNAEPPRRRRSMPMRLPRRRTVVLAIAACVAAATALAPSLRSRASVMPATTTNRAANDFYQRGLAFERRDDTRENLDGARKLYRHALDLDPTFALANARLAIVICHLVTRRGGIADSIVAQARPAAEAAVRVQPNLGVAHLALGLVWIRERRQQQAMAEFERAVALTPDDPDVHMELGRLLRGMGPMEPAMRHFERASRLDSNNAAVLDMIARRQSARREYRAAIATLDRMLVLAPNDRDAALTRGWLYLAWQGTTDSLAATLRALPPDWDPQGVVSWSQFTIARIARRPAAALAAATAMRDSASWGAPFHRYRPRTLLQAQAYAELGDRRRARAYFTRAHREIVQTLAVLPKSPVGHAALALAYAGLGSNARAAAAADTAMTLGGPSSAMPMPTIMMAECAEIHMRIGDVDGTLALLERLLSMPAGSEISVPLLRVDPLWDPLRRNPRFEQMLRRFAPRDTQTTRIR